MQTTPGTSLSDTAPATTPPRSSRALWLWATVAVVAYALDQSTKAWAVHALDGEPAREVLGSWVQFRLTSNPGAAFSLGTGYTVVLTVVALGVIAVCLTMASRIRSRAWAVALGLLLGGALGNVTDRVFRDPAPFRGHVIDFIELPNWPIFNVADMAICTAAGLFVLLSLRGIRLDGTVHGVGSDHEDDEPGRKPTAEDS